MDRNMPVLGGIEATVLIRRCDERGGGCCGGVSLMRSLRARAVNLLAFRLWVCLAVRSTAMTRISLALVRGLHCCVRDNVCVCVCLCVYVSCIV